MRERVELVRSQKEQGNFGWEPTIIDDIPPGSFNHGYEVVMRKLSDPKSNWLGKLGQRIFPEQDIIVSKVGIPLDFAVKGAINSTNPK